MRSGRQERAAARMRKWAQEHPECDTQGILDDEWLELAAVALDDRPTGPYFKLIAPSGRELPRRYATHAEAAAIRRLVGDQTRIGCFDKTGKVIWQEGPWVA